MESKQNKAHKDVPTELVQETAPITTPIAATSKKTNTLAIVAFIFAFLVSPVGLILGIIALAKIKKNQEGGKGLAIASIIISIVITATLILFTILTLFVYHKVSKVINNSNESSSTTSSSFDCSHDITASEVDTMQSTAATFANYISNSNYSAAYKMYTNTTQPPVNLEEFTKYFNDELGKELTNALPVWTACEVIDGEPNTALYFIMYQDDVSKPKDKYQTYSIATFDPSLKMVVEIYDVVTNEAKTFPGSTNDTLNYKNALQSYESKILDNINGKPTPGSKEMVSTRGFKLPL